MQTGPQLHQPVRLIRIHPAGASAPSHDFRHYLLLVRGLRAAATLATVPFALHVPDYAGVCDRSRIYSPSCADRAAFLFLSNFCLLRRPHFRARR